MLREEGAVSGLLGRLFLLQGVWGEGRIWGLAGHLVRFEQFLEAETAVSKNAGLCPQARIV